MKDIKELYEKTYGVSNPSDEQMQHFINLLKEKLSTKELEYISYRYNVDLLDFAELENKIVNTMKDEPPCSDNQNKKESDDVEAVFEKLKENEYITISLIQRKCSMGFCSSSKILDQMIERNMISPTNTKWGYRVNKEY